jgi:hypothetical protein
VSPEPRWLCGVCDGTVLRGGVAVTSSFESLLRQSVLDALYESCADSVPRQVVFGDEAVLLAGVDRDSTWAGRVAVVASVEPNRGQSPCLCRCFPAPACVCRCRAVGDGGVWRASMAFPLLCWLSVRPCVPPVVVVV